MSAALETLLEAARYIELMERQRGDRVHTVHLHETTINSDNLNHSSIISSHNSSYQPPNNISSINNNNNNNISNNFSVNNNNNSTIRYNNVANNQLFISSPQVSPITTSNLNNILQNSHHHQVIHQQQQRNEFNNMVNASNTIRIEPRRVNNNEETFGPSGVTTNGHSSVAPPLVVISPQQQINNNSSNHNNSLSPPSTSSSSFELSRSRSSSVSSTTLPPSTTPTITHLSGGGHTITTNGLYQHQLQNGGDDSNQSSLNLSNVSSGYISGSSANSSIGSTNLNISGNLSNLTNGILTISEQQTLQAQSIAAGGRRRTTSTNSNGTQRSPCILRAGTREVHNKLEKNRRAHLKECFEQLKKQLPSMPEEKKTSNLSILGAAIRFVGSLKRKERELEHEMERLAKEKIAAQQKILLLKRELSAQWDHIDFSTIIPETDVGTIREREPVNELSLGRGCPRYSSTSSLSSVATSSSPCTTIGVAISSPMPITTNSTSMPSVISTTQFNNINNNNINNSNINNNNQNKLNSSHPIMNHNNNNNNVSSPNNILVNNHNNNNNLVSLPLSFSQQQQHTLKTTSQQQQQHHHHQMIEMSMQSLNKKTNQMAINLTSDGTSALIVASNASNMPLNLNNNLSNNNNNINVNLSNNKASSPSPSTIITTSSSATTNNLLTQSLQIISTNTHNLNSNNIVHNINSKDMLTHKNGIRVAEIGRQEPVPSLMLNKELNKVELLTAKLADSSEPPTKVIKLINGSTIALTSVDKDNKIIGSSPTTLTLQQVVGGGGLVVSPIPLLTSSQGLRVIGQSQNGIATIELSTPLGQQQARNALQNHVTACGANGPQLHKLLVSGTTSVVTQSSTTVTPELARLPGGAELNILPANSNGTLYRSQKLAFVNNGITIKGDGNSSSRVQLVTPIQSNNSSLSGLTPIVVNHQQGQGTTNIAQLIAASTSQMSGKVMTPITVSPYVVKPMMVAVASSSATSSLTTASMSKQQTILAAPSNNNTSINGNCI